ncbi:peroxidase [Lottiidibacillus patelloidae]|nr:peroxidase-related enzyme [Lottiidibacillus patelloidae]OZM57439.1 peroxidase [Lottiidibacillus patelloidae]
MEHHGAALHMLTKDKELVLQLKENYLEASLDEKTKAMLSYAVQLTRRPASVKDEHVNQLRNHGFSDRAILDICQIAAYFNFVNRMAEGLGVQLEEK